MKNTIKYYAQIAAIIVLAASLTSIITLRVAHDVAERDAQIVAQEQAQVEAEAVVETPAPEVIVKYIVVTVPEVTKTVAEEETAEEAEPSYFIDCAMSEELQTMLFEACEECGLDFVLALAVVKTESNFQNVMGDNGHAYGYMQIQQRFHEARMEKLGVTDLMDAESNFRVGCDLLAELIGKYGTEGGLTAYNTGHSGTSYYATKVLSAYEDLKGAK